MDPWLPFESRAAEAALRWLWAAVLTLGSLAVALALVIGGVIFAGVGIAATLNPNHLGHALAGVLFALTGVAAVLGSVLAVWKLMPPAVVKLSGRRPPRFGSGRASLSGFGGFGSGGVGGCGGDGGGGASC